MTTLPPVICVGAAPNDLLGALPHRLPWPARWRPSKPSPSILGCREPPGTGARRLQGAGAALVALAATVAVLGPAVGQIPLDPLRLVVGALLLVFGLQWLRKAIMRGSGYKALHDEAAAYAEEVRPPAWLENGGRGMVRDW